MSGRLAEVVQMEALAAGRRRQLARQTGTTSDRVYGSGHQWGDQLREIADQLDSDEVIDRRNRALDRLAAPSDLIYRALRDWPKQVDCVAAFAEAEGISMGEAWRRTIAAGVDALLESDD
jgi:hypothetical protein